VRIRLVFHSALARSLGLAAGVVVFSTAAAGQTPSIDYLRNGIARVEAGDFQLGVMMLNEVVAPGSKADAATIARAHAYRAQGFLGLKQPDNARAAAMLAVKADANLSITSPPFARDLVALFEEIRRPAAAPSPETAAAIAEQAGNQQEAFAAYVAAYQALSVPAPLEDDRRLREKIITLARRLGPPAIPQDARAHYTKADQLLAAQEILKTGRTASLEAAAIELQSAVRIAPWWADATFKLAKVLQELQRVDAALMNLELYRLADPEGYAKATAATVTASPERSDARVEPPRAATVHLYWPKQSRGGGPKKTYCDGVLVAELRDGHFIALTVPGGSHNFKVTSKSETFLFEPGKNYYVRASVEGFPAMFKLRLVDANEAAAELREKSITANEPAHTYSNQCTAVPPPRR
jgi:tetratricopeptide (TPR) repeat protein